MEVYLGMCRRWRDIPKPSIAMVHGACIAGGLMLAWVCDLIVAAQDAFFADPVVKMGIPGVEYFAHPWMLGPRFAKEVLFTGGRFTAERAYAVGMVNRVVPRAELAAATFAMAAEVAAMPSFGLALARRGVNKCADQMGVRPGLGAVFGYRGRVRAAPGVGARAGRGRPGGGLLAGRLRRAGRVPAGLAGVRGGVLRGRRPGPGRPERPAAARPHPVRARHPAAAGPA